MPKTTGRTLGEAGERRAADWYRRNGYEVVERNWRCRDGELDLIVRKARMLVFCEVKTRRSVAFGSPAEAITAAKRARLRRLAARWLAERPLQRGGPVRFDVVAILPDRLDVIEAAF